VIRDQVNRPSWLRAACPPRSARRAPAPARP